MSFAGGNLWAVEPGPSRSTVDLGRKTAGLAPKTAGLTPKATGLTPKTTGLTPKTTGLAPKTAGLTPKTAGLTPETTGLTPKTAGLTPKTTGLTSKTTGLTRKTAGLTPKTAGLPHATSMGAHRGRASLSPPSTSKNPRNESSAMPGSPINRARGERSELTSKRAGSCDPVHADLLHGESWGRTKRKVTHVSEVEQSQSDARGAPCDHAGDRQDPHGREDDSLPEGID